MGRGVLALQRWLTRPRPDEIASGHASTRVGGRRGRVPVPGGPPPPATGSSCSWSGSRWRRWRSVWSGAYGAKTDNGLTLPGTDSQAAFDILAERVPAAAERHEPVRVPRSTRASSPIPRPKAAIAATYKAIKSAPPGRQRRQPAHEGPRTTVGLLSEDGRIAFMPVLLKVDSGFITDRLGPDHPAMPREPATKAGIEVAVGGSIGSVLSSPDTGESELIGNVSAMVILALVFGSLIAMGTPIVTAVVALSIGLSAIGLLGHVIAIPSVAPTPGDDDRPRRRHRLRTVPGDQAPGSARRGHGGEGVDRPSAVASSGSAIVFAGGTVVIALASLAVAGIPLVTSLGLSPQRSPSSCAVLASITLLPAILSLLGGTGAAGADPRLPHAEAAPGGPASLGCLGARRWPGIHGSPWSARWRSWSR